MVPMEKKGFALLLWKGVLLALAEKSPRCFHRKKQGAGPEKGEREKGGGKAFPGMFLLGRSPSRSREKTEPESEKGGEGEGPACFLKTPAPKSRTLWPREGGTSRGSGEKTFCFLGKKPRNGGTSFIKRKRSANERNQGREHQRSRRRKSVPPTAGGQNRRLEAGGKRIKGRVPRRRFRPFLAKKNERCAGGKKPTA